MTSPELRIGTENFDRPSPAARGSNSRDGGGAQEGSLSLPHAGDPGEPKRPNDPGSKPRWDLRNSLGSRDASQLNR